MGGDHSDTAFQFDAWDNSNVGNHLKILKHAVVAYQKRCKLVAQHDEIITDEEVRTHESNVVKMKKLQDLHNGIAEKLKRACRRLVEQQTKLKEMCRAEVRGQRSEGDKYSEY